MQTVLVVGGAGYIGSHMCKYLAAQGVTPIVLDNLCYGHRQAVRWGPLYEADLDDEAVLNEIFQTHHIDVVMHFAAFAYVGESVKHPARYYQNNLIAPITLLKVMGQHGIDKFIFSSTCATYGVAEQIPITESEPQSPINPYGNTKLMLEMVLKDYATAYDLKSVSLRYFNAAGADSDGEIGEHHDPETHLIPLAIKAAMEQQQPLKVFGNDYPTADGTCVRDYIHITDLASAHYLAMQHLLTGGESRQYNLGNGNGYSVLDVINSINKFSAKPVPFEFAPRREGDPAVLVGSAEKIKNELNWQPQFADLDSIVASAWRWHSNQPEGYLP